MNKLTNARVVLLLTLLGSSTGDWLDSEVSDMIVGAHGFDSVYRD